MFNTNTKLAEALIQLSAMERLIWLNMAMSEISDEAVLREAFLQKFHYKDNGAARATFQLTLEAVKALRGVVKMEMADFMDQRHEK